MRSQSTILFNLRAGNKVILAGDWAPGSNEVTLQIAAPFCMLANLEAPFLDSQNHQASRKAGPHMRTNSLPSSEGKTIFTLANNHIMDYGKDGLQSTVKELNHRGIYWLGAGVNNHESKQPLILEIEGVRYGILARCEAQFGMATQHRSGAALLDASIYSSVTHLRPNVDIVIVTVHAASEMSPWPSPQRQVSYRAIIDAGADIVHGHHSHVPQGYEYYNDGLVFYGMGNLCVEPEIWSDHPNALWSIVANIECNNKKITTSITPFSITQDEERLAVKPSVEALATEHLDYLEKCNRPLANIDLLTGLWQENSMRLYKLNYQKWLGLQKPLHQLGIKAQIRQLVKTLLTQLRLKQKSIPKISSRDRWLLWHVLFSCESHNDAIATAFGILSGELGDLRDDEIRRMSDEMMPWSKVKEECRT